MDSKFTIQYGEFVVAEYLSEIEDISVFIPASPQEKGIDLIAYKAKSKNRIQTVQVKMSRSYTTDKKYQNTLWFNRFIVPDNADWFFFVGIYAEFSEKHGVSVSEAVKWNEIMLAFNHEEMKQFMSEVKLKRSPDKDDTKFGFGFNDKTRIFQTRGYPEERDMSKYLIENRLDEFKTAFER